MNCTTHVQVDNTRHGTQASQKCSRFGTTLCSCVNIVYLGATNHPHPKYHGGFVTPWIPRIVAQPPPAPEGFCGFCGFSGFWDENRPPWSVQGMCDMHKLHIQANTGRPRHFTRKHPSRLQAPFKSSSLCIAVISHQVSICQCLAN